MKTKNNLFQRSFSVVGHKTMLALIVAGAFSIYQINAQTVTTGGLTSGYVPVATGTSFIQNGIIQDNGYGIGIGTNPASGFALNLNGAINTIGINNASGGITSAGSISGATTIATSGVITAYGLNNSSSGITNCGAISGATTIAASSGITAHGLNNSSSGITNAGAISGATTITASGAISGTTITGSGLITGVGLNNSGSSFNNNYAGITNCGTISGYTFGGGGALTGTSLTASAGDINLASSTNSYMIGPNKVLWISPSSGVYSNLFVGVGAGNSGTTSGSNAAFGYQALNSANTNGYCTAIGAGALKLTTGPSNTAIGYYALPVNAGGSYNTACGLYAGFNNTAGGYNTFLGMYSGYGNTIGSYNTCVGYAAYPSTAALTNATAIGYGAIVNASYKIRVGDPTVTVIEGQVAFTTSDGRFKNNVKEEVKGLEFIKKLRPVNYNFDTKKFDEFLIKNMPDSIKILHRKGVDYTPSTNIIRTGFIAQEVEKAAKDCGFITDIVHVPVDENDNYSIAYGNMIVPLVKAVQELSKITDNIPTVKTQQDSTINALNAKIQYLQNQISNCCTKVIIGKSFIDNAVSPTTTGSNLDGSAINATSITTPVLFQNSPNPFSQQTSIQYSIPTNTQSASIMVFDLTGKLIKTIPITSFGNGSITINGNELSPGMFVYSLIVDGKIVDTKRMILTQ